MPGEFGEDSYDDFDVAGAAAEIGASLFNSGDSKEATVVEDGKVVEPKGAEGEVGEPSAQPTAKAGETDPTAKPSDPTAPTVVPGQNSETAPLPKSWKKDMAPEWEKTSPAVKAYVIEREAQVMRGINQYAANSQNWTRLTEPFAPVLAQFPDVNPIELMQGLTATHLHLLSPTTPAAEKIQIVQSLLKEYGIALDASQAPAQDAILLARLEKAERLASQAQQGVQSWQQTQQRRELESGVAAVNAFAADPKNKYFNEVGDNIIHLIKTGAAPDLPSAYEQACWTNPAVRVKMLAEQQVTTAPTAKPRDKNGQFVNLDADPGKARVKPISIDSTIDDIVTKHYSTQAH